MNFPVEMAVPCLNILDLCFVIFKISSMFVLKYCFQPNLFGLSPRKQPTIDTAHDGSIGFYAIRTQINSISLYVR
jgi:hypothetical protein